MTHDELKTIETMKQTNRKSLQKLIGKIINLVIALQVVQFELSVFFDDNKINKITLKDFQIPQKL